VQVRILGSKSKLSKMETRYAIHWSLEQMMPAHQLKNLRICVSFRDMLPYNENAGERIDKKTIKGCCTDYAEGRKFPNYFLIKIANRYYYPKKKCVQVLPKSQQIKTLFHELRHVVQSATGVARYTTSETHIIWKNRMMKMDETDEEYENAPWEIDAYAWEKRLSRKYNAHIQKIGLKFP
jgi:hypothetical protein